MRPFLPNHPLNNMHMMEAFPSIHTMQITDNSRFADAGFQKAVKEANQTITFCAVGAHHQNKIVE